MPRTRLPSFDQLPIHPKSLVGLLADELRTPKTSGQPAIKEELFKSGLLRVVVLWDRWAGWPQEERSIQIVMSYREVEGQEYAGKISLATGLTFPEAHASGMLPFQVIAALRRGDSVSVEQCHEAMIKEGASTLLDPERPRLWFATEGEAEACRDRLAARLPGSEPVWQIFQDVGQNLGGSWDLSD